MKLPIIPIYISNIFKGKNKKNWLIKHPVIEGVTTAFVNLFKRIHIFIGEPIDPFAENIIRDLQSITDKKSYKKIINDINQSLYKEFLDLEREAKKIFSRLADERTASCIKTYEPLQEFLVDDEEVLAEDTD
jgi:hypothetical protein